MPKTTLSPEKQKEILAQLAVDANATRVAKKVGGVSNTLVQRLARKNLIPLFPGRTSSSLSNELKAQIAADLMELPNAGVIARRYGVSDSVPRRIASEKMIDLIAGKAVRKQPRLPAEKEAEIVAALRIKSNAKAIARQIEGATHMIVLRLARKEGIDLAAGRTSGRGDRKASNPRKPCTNSTDTTDNVVNPHDTIMVVQPSQPLSPGQESITSTITTNSVDGNAAILTEIIDDEDREPGNANKPDSGLQPLTFVGTTTPLFVGRATKTADVAVNNLVRALARARVSGDKARMSLLLSSSPVDMLQQALKHIRASKSKLSNVPVK